MHFDPRAAKLLQSGQHMVIEGCPGLRMVASATRKTWIYRYKSPTDGRMRQVSIGPWPATTVQTAAERWQALRDARGAGADPAVERRAERRAEQVAAPAVYTVDALVRDYITGHLATARQPAGALAAERALLRVLADSPELAQRAAESVTRTDAYKLLEARRGHPTAAAKLRSLLGAAWDVALDAGRLPDNAPNWWRQVLKGKLKSRGKIVGGEHVGPQRRVLRPAEIAALLAWLPNMHAVAADTVQMYLWTCARGVEILGMRPEQISEEGDGWWWTVPRVATKNARHERAVDHRVPLIGRALQIVQGRLGAVGPAGWLFADVDGRQYTQHRLSTYIYDLQPHSAKSTRRQGQGLALPVAGWTPHALRRTGRTLLASLGCIDEIGEAILGHLPRDIVGVYNAYTYDAERRQWLSRLADYLEEVAAASVPAAVGLPARP